MNGAPPASSVSTPSAPPSRSKLVLDDEPLVEVDPGVGQAAPVARQPLAGRRTATAARRGTRSGDGRARRAPPTIAAIPAALSTPISGSPSGVRREVDDRRAVGPHRREVPVDLLVQRRVVEAAAGEDDAAAARSSAAAGRTSARAPASRSELQVMTQEARRRRRVLDAADDLREVRVGDVVDDHGDDRDPALEQPAGEGVRDVVERPGGLEHALARRRADRVVGRRDDPRRRRRRHAGEPGDLGDGCHRRSADQ